MYKTRDIKDQTFDGLRHIIAFAKNYTATQNYDTVINLTTIFGIVAMCVFALLGLCDRLWKWYKNRKETLDKKKDKVDRIDFERKKSVQK